MRRVPRDCPRHLGRIAAKRGDRPPIGWALVYPCPRLPGELVPVLVFEQGDEKCRKVGSTVNRLDQKIPVVPIDRINQTPMSPIHVE